MEKKTKQTITVLAVVDVVVLLLLVLVFVLGILANGNGTVSGKVKKQTLEVSYDGKGEAGEDSYVITGSDEKVAEQEKYLTENGDYIFPDSDSTFLSEGDLAGLSDWELKLARNEIYARHGRMFDDDALAEYFNGKSWYHPTYSPQEFDAMGDSVFNQYEIANRDLIKKAEKK